MAFGTLLTNMRAGSGFIKCHDLLDLEPSSSGSLGVTNSVEITIMQRLFIWMATPKGELPFDANYGCCVHSYMHRAINSGMLKELEADLQQDLNHVFPEFSILSIKLGRYSQNEVQASFIIGDHNISLVFDRETLLEMQIAMRGLFDTIGYLR